MFKVLGDVMAKKCEPGNGMFHVLFPYSWVLKGRVT